MARGRPRKAGPRKPCGRLVQKVDPNPKVVELRRAMLNDPKADLANAENPMDLALQRGWITEDQHRAGSAYATAWRRSHPRRRTTGSLQEAPERHYDPRPIAQMGSLEIAQAFDAIFSGVARDSSDESEARARRRYNEMSARMRPDEQNEVFLCFCLASWPQWIVQRCAGRFDTNWERKRLDLVRGLDALAQYVVAPAQKRA